LATGQADPLGSIHLPNLMGPAGALVVAGRPSARRRWRQCGTLQPTLQRSLAGASFVLLLQQNANQAGAPAGMLLAHLYDLLERGAVRG
jgi:hypothetical protein